MIRVRSVVPGRQRWDIGMVLARPQVAEHLEAELRKSPGVRVVRANPVTGRLLVCHDTALSSEKVVQLVWEAVTPLAAQQAMVITRSSRPKPSVGSAWARRQLFALVGSAVLALAFTLDGLLRRSPLPQLGPATAATVVGLQHALQQSARAQQLLSSPLLFLLFSSPFAPPLPRAFFSTLSSLSSAVSRSS
ncbi:MAG: HMA2 domain-containing protein [Pseudonocardiaceae bacterium]